MTTVDLRELALRAKASSRKLALLPTETRDAAIRGIAQRLDSVGPELWAANQADLEEARAANIAPSLLDRAALTESKVAGMAAGCRDVANLVDPLGEVFDGRTMPNGLRLAKKRVPLGVMGVIFESRPNVTTEISALCIKTGNAVIMRGGKESLRTNGILIDLVREALAEVGAPEDAVQLIRTTDRSLVPELLGMDDLVDLIIPRGGPGLQALVKQHAKMPVIYGGIGVCHLYVDSSADIARSVPIIHNAKTQAPSVCNALDTVLVHRDAVAALMPPMAATLTADGVQIYCDGDSLAALDGAIDYDAKLVAPAEAEHYGKEFLGLAFSVKVVDSLDEAVEHIQEYGTNHSDGILTNDLANATRFQDQVDSAAVYVNASTRFTDGGQFGLGAEVAISTQRMHARGPLGLVELTTYKWICQGDYHVRA